MISLDSSIPSSSQRAKILRVIESRSEKIKEENSEYAWTREIIERDSLKILEELKFPKDFLAYTMVAVGSFLWQREVEAISYTRRILLLPHCLRNASECRATISADGLSCLECGKCVLGELKSRGEKLGYCVIIAEGTPIVMRQIISGNADAILGVGCLKSLERSFDKLALAAIPAMAVPLLSATCKDTEVDVAQVHQLIDTPFVPRAKKFASRFVPLLRRVAQLFDSQEIESILPFRNFHETALHDTEKLAREFILRGGKFYRPFITLAVYHALRDNTALRGNDVEAIPTDVLHVAAAMEIFHKASLIHDDIEDDDPFRYGIATLHREFGIATAINVGDYLIGAGYRLVAETESLSSSVRLKIITILATAHTQLAEGQGADIIYRERNLSLLDTVKVLTLKTAPAFLAAILSGVVLADEEFLTPQLRETLVSFCRYIGVAFQIRNDINDLRADRDNKKSFGNDAAQKRPTILRALADEANDNAQENNFILPATMLQSQYLMLARKTISTIAKSHPALHSLLIHLTETITQ